MFPVKCPFHKASNLNCFLPSEHQITVKMETEFYAVPRAQNRQIFYLYTEIAVITVL